MKLPDAQLAVVEEQKIREYLLNAAHADNGGKAKFFFAQGFTDAEWEKLAFALIELAATLEVQSRVESIHGTKFIIDGPIRTQAGESPVIRTIWIIDRGMPHPRLVTAYPTG